MELVNNSFENEYVDYSLKYNSLMPKIRQENAMKKILPIKQTNSNQFSSNVNGNVGPHVISTDIDQFETSIVLPNLEFFDDSISRLDLYETVVFHQSSNYQSEDLTSNNLTSNNLKLDEYVPRLKLFQLGSSLFSLSESEAVTTSRKPGKQSTKGDFTTGSVPENSIAQNENPSEPKITYNCFQSVETVTSIGTFSSNESKNSQISTKSHNIRKLNLFQYLKRKMGIK